MLKQSLSQAMRLVVIAQEERTKDHKEIGKATDLGDQVNYVVNLTNTDDRCWVWLNVNLKHKTVFLRLRVLIKRRESCFTRGKELFFLAFFLLPRVLKICIKVLNFINDQGKSIDSCFFCETCNI